MSANIDSRQAQLLRLIIEEYVDSTEPVGSQFLIESSDLEWSAATVRNEMRELEDTGYLTHPHTSAGRIPTEAGYRYYVDHLMPIAAISKADIRRLRTIAQEKSKALSIGKDVGKYVAERSSCAVIIAWSNDSVYYTGISNLFSQPEFRDSTQTVNVSAIFDQCEDRLPDLLEIIPQDKTTVLIGSEHEFGDSCSLVATRFGRDYLFTMVAPMRMDYVQSIGLADAVREILS